MKRLLFILFAATMSMLTVSAAFGEGTKAAPAKAEEKQAAEPQVYFKVPMFSPLFSGFPVATLDDQQVTLEQLNDALGAMHQGPSEEKGAAMADFMPVLDRLVNTRLIAIEAKGMGMDDLPEVKDAVKNYSGATMRELLKAKQTEGVEPVKKDVEKYYREAVAEWKLKSYIFDKEDDAKAVSEAAAKGKDLDTLAAKYVSEKKAKGGEKADYLGANKLLSQITFAARKMKKGEVSKPIKVPNGYVVFRVEDIRYPEDAKARAEAAQQSEDEQRDAVLHKFYDKLVKKYASIDRKLLDSLDFESKEPGFEKLLKDKRTLATIKGEKPVTVGDLTDAIAEKFYHGVGRQIKEKKLNSAKLPTFNELLYNRLFDKEAVREGINKTDAYKKMISEYKTSLLFSVFVQKVLVPDIKVTEEESKKYYDEHKKDFTYPEMIKLYSLAFKSPKDASGALDKLKKGTDFKWLKQNAEGQVKESDGSLIVFDGETVSADSLGEGLGKALSGVKSGDYRIYSSPDGVNYVLYAKDVVPPNEQPYKEARETVAKKIYSEKLNKSVEVYADKLRKAHDVRVYVTRIGG